MSANTPNRGAARDIKREHDLQNSPPSENGLTSATNHNSSFRARAPPPSSHSLYSAATDTPGSVAPLSYRHGRSDAPTPSERAEDAEPLFREIRTIPRMSQPNGNGGGSGPEEGSFFQESFKGIAQILKAFNDALGELQQLGVSHDVQLPELVLVGDQSAGKSSLMSGLAQLDLPRSEGTCTRCPLHIRVSMNPEWSCRVWLRKEYTYAPPSDGCIQETDVTSADPFFPWKKRAASDIQEFKTMHDNTEIEEVLRWAQVAILNDDQNPALFVPGSGSIACTMPISEAAEATSAKFSPNIVALEIKGPDLPDLSFYDMPGIFQNPADARDDYLVSVVANLSKAYIQHPSAIIMCSMPMNSDAENSSTFGLTRKLGASNRTIGVLTKADLLPPEGNHDQWLSIMKGEAHKTGLGYFITSRPQGKTLEELSKWEDGLFVDQIHDSWPAEFHQFGDRCGVEKLKMFLSEKLAEAFAKSLPNIKRKVASRLKKVTNDLQALPELPDNIELEIQTSLMQFFENCRQGVDEFVKEGGRLPAAFRDTLLHIKPKFTLKDKSDQPVVEISDDESDAAPMAPTPSKRQHDNSFTTPSKRARLDRANGIPNGTPHPVKSEEAPSPTVSTMSSTPRPKRTRLDLPFTEYSSLGSGFRTLAQVKAEVLTKMKAGVPNVIPVDVYQDMALEAMRVWEMPIRTFLQETMAQLHRKLQQKMDISLHNLRRRLIYREMVTHLKDFLTERFKETESELARAFQDETRQLLTFNTDTFDYYVKKETEDIEYFRHKMRYDALYPGQGLDWASMTQDVRISKAKEYEKEKSKLGRDSFESMLRVIGYVRGYYRLAALRFADRAAQLTLCHMIPQVRLQLDWVIRNKLGLYGSDAAAMYQRLMEEDTTTASRRETLKSEREKFVRALETIQALETGPSLDETMYDTSVSTIMSQSFGGRGGVVIGDSQSTSDLASGEA